MRVGTQPQELQTVKGFIDTRDGSNLEETFFSHPNWASHVKSQDFLEFKSANKEKIWIEKASSLQLQ